MKKIVIMGATSGIGEHVAESLAATGWRVGVAGRKVDRMKAQRDVSRFYRMGSDRHTKVGSAT